MTFAEIEKLVGQLPPSARIHRAWWANGASAAGEGRCGSAGFAGGLGECAADPIGTGNPGLFGGAGDGLVQLTGQPHTQQR